MLVFFLIHLIPGDPARTMLGLQATDARVAELHHQWGLDRPLPVQYWLFMKRLIHGDLGHSLYYDSSAASLVVDRLGPTLWLLAYATVLSILITVPLATIAATKKDGFRD